MSLFGRMPMALAAGIALLLTLAPSADPQEGKRTARVYFPNGEHVLAELALSVKQRANGLMFRDQMAPDEGMLFFLDEEAIHPFWMKNVRFSIDILWLDREKKIVHLAKNVPPCRKEPCPFYSPVLPSLYVLELTAGRADALGLKPGSKLQFTFPQH